MSVFNHPTLLFSGGGRRVKTTSNAGRGGGGKQKMLGTTKSWQTMEKISEKKSNRDVVILNLYGTQHQLMTTFPLDSTIHPLPAGVRQKVKFIQLP